jgi:hypothetical protein
VEFKIDVPYTSEAKKLEPEYKMTAPHDHKHIVGTYHLLKVSWSKQLQNALVQNSLGKHGFNLLESS